MHSGDFDVFGYLAVWHCAAEGGEQLQDG